MIRLLLLAMAAAASGSFAQTGDSPKDYCRDTLEDIVNKAGANPASGERLIEQALDFTNAQPCMAQLFADYIKTARVRAIQKSLQGRLNNQQLTSTTAPQGTTSPISKPATSALSLISEYGGVTTSTQNQTATIQISPYKVPSNLAASGWVPYCDQWLAVTRECISGGLLQQMNRLSASITANTNTSAQSLAAVPVSGSTSTGSAQPVTATASGSRAPSFAGATGKYVLWYNKGKAGKLDFSKVDYSTATGRLNQLVRDLAGNRLYAQWQSCLAADLSAIWVDPSAPHKTLRSPAEIGEAIKNALEDYVKIADILRLGEPLKSCHAAITLPPAGDLKAARASDQQFIADLPAAIAALDQIQAQIDAAIIQTMTTPALSVEYDFSAPVNQPTYSIAKLAYSYTHQGAEPASKTACPASPTGAGKPAGTVACPSWTLTLNAGLSWYSATPASSIPGSSLLRDLQVGIEWDQPIASSQWKAIGSLIGDTTLSATYYYQDQTSPSILKVTPGSPVAGITLTGLPATATQVFTQKGNIHCAQLRYAFGTGTNVKFPVAVTWSNRSELIARPTWGAQFGVSYDFSSLLGSPGGANK